MRPIKACVHASPLATLIFTVVLLTDTASAQQRLTEHTLNLAPGQTPSPATIADMAWLAGHWTGDGLGGRSEEIWSPPAHGVMMGMYRNIKGDAPLFYELLTLSEEKGSLIIRLKHFNPDLTGWEEKDQSVSFPFVAKRDGVFHFSGMAFKPTGADTVTIYLAIENRQDKTVREAEFYYTRVKPGTPAVVK
jgi:hypothetical protein